MSGPNPISYDIIMGWCYLNNIKLTPWEISVVKSLDNLWIKVTGEEDGN
jgi:hypothetical protein